MLRQEREMGCEQGVGDEAHGAEEASGEIEDRFLKTKGICRYLGISKSTFYRLLGDESSGLSDIIVCLPGVDGPRALQSRLREWAESGK